MFRGSNHLFEAQLSRATSPTQLELDWDAVLTICDLVRQGDVKADHAVERIHEKLNVKNPHTCLHAIKVLDALVKNCGKPVHDEVITRTFLDKLYTLAATSTNTDVRTRVLEVLQCWAHGFKDKSQYSAAKDLVALLKAEGHQFPTMSDTDATFDAAVAPEWTEGDNCTRCRTAFSTFLRQHHCRNCGNVFCGKCSSKTAAIPQFGLEKEVRVCESCYTELRTSATTTGGSASDKTESNTKGGEASALPPELQDYFNSPLAKEEQKPTQKTSEDKLKEEEELQLALALSQSEVEAQTPKMRHNSTGSTKSASAKPGKSILKSAAGDGGAASDDLDKYLNRPYWEERVRSGSMTEPSAPIASAPVADNAGKEVS